MTSPFGHASQAIAKKETQAMRAKTRFYQQGEKEKKAEGKKYNKKRAERNIAFFARSSVITIPGLLSSDVSVSFHIVYFVELNEVFQCGHASTHSRNVII